MLCYCHQKRMNHAYLCAFATTGKVLTTRKFNKDIDKEIEGSRGRSLSDFGCTWCDVSKQCDE